MHSVCISLWLLPCILTLAPGKEEAFPGWRKYNDIYYHEFCANLPPWNIVDLDKSKPELPKKKVLPPGWIASENGYTDTVTGDTSREWPPGFQNEAHFKSHYMRLVEHVSASWSAHWAEISQFNFSDSSPKARKAVKTYLSSLPPDFMEVVLRVVKAPCLLADRSTNASLQIPDADILAAARMLIQSHGAASEHDAPAKMLFIIMGQTFDHYHGDDAYTLPQYMVDGMKGLFESDEERSVWGCRNWGFPRDSHALPEKGPKGHKAQSDLSVVAFIRHFFPDIDLDVIDPCRGLQQLKDPAFLDSYDFVVNGHFGPIGASLKLDERYPFLGFDAFERALQETKAYVWNPPWIVAISNKSHIPMVLRKHGIPAVPTVSVTFGDETPESAEKAADDLIQQALSDGWQTIFIKPNEQGYMRDLGLFNIGKDTKRELLQYFKKLQSMSLRGVCAQKYVASFKNHYEVRLYFFGGRFGTSIGNKVDAFKFSDGNRHDFFHWDWFDFEGGILNSSEYKVREKLIPLAERALRVIADEVPVHRALLPAGVDAHPLFRVDLGCCLDPSDSGYHDADGWFVNEAEALPNFNLDHFTRFLVNVYGGWNGIDWLPAYVDYDLMTKMVERAAAAWYPTTEHTALELARMVKKVVATRRSSTSAHKSNAARGTEL